jgi:hypothetical protein
MLLLTYLDCDWKRDINRLADYYQTPVNSSVTELKETFIAGMLKQPQFRLLLIISYHTDILYITTNM